MRRFVVGFFVFIWISILVGIMFPSLMYRLGTFLVVDEKAPPVDAVVTGWVTDKVIQCYQTGRCRKIFLIRNKESPPTWKALSRLKLQSSLKEIVRKSRIKDSDYFIFFQDETSKNKFKFIYKILREHEARSALILARYYKTRRYRFFMDRYEGKKEFAVYIQPQKDQYLSNFDRWWEHTAFSNYFLTEYLRIAYFYFNQILWTRLFVNFE